MRTEAGEAQPREPETIRSTCQRQPTPPVKRPYPARRPRRVYTPDIHLPPRASKREAEREKLRESWREEARARNGEGFPEAVGGMGGGGEGTQALRRQECSRRGAVACPLSAAPPSVGSSAPSVITPAVTTPGLMTQSRHSPTRHDRRCTPPHCTLGKERRGVGRRGRTPPHGQSLTHPSPVHYPCSQGPPSLAGAPIPPIRQLGPRMPHPKAGVPGGEAEMPTRVPRPPHPIAPSHPLALS